MHKRQDAPYIRLPRSSFSPLLLMFIFCLSACQPQQSPPLTTPHPILTTTTPTVPQPTGTSTTPLITQGSEPPVPSATPTPDCLLAGGELQDVAVYSEQLDADFEFRVYLPPCYQNDPAQGYPVLYLLHGLLYTNEQWLRVGLVEAMNRSIADSSLPSFIVILPQETPFIPPQASRFPNALIEDLIPIIDSRYNTLAEKDFRALGGLSRGAAWAIRIGFTYPAFFNSIGAHSLPLFEADGGKVSGWLIQTPIADLPRFYIDIGRDDPEWQTALTFSNLLDHKNIPHEWYLFRGGHTEDYWSEHLETYLKWYARNW